MAITVMGSLVGLYAVLQNYGLDFLDLMEPPSATRSTSTLGNPIFAANVMLITLPVTLVLATLAIRESVRTPGFWWKAGLWSAILVIQLLGMIFTSSRGPWFGTILALLGCLGLAYFCTGWRLMGRMALLLILAFVLVVAVLFWPSQSEEDSPAARSEVVEDRLTAIRSQGAGGLGIRVEIWKGSWRLMTRHPWFEFDDLSMRTIRPLVGYGPDLFRATYMLESLPNSAQNLLPNEVAHAHNYLIHQAVELGFLGNL